MGAVLFSAMIVAIMLLRPSFFPALFTAIARPFWRVQLSVELGALKSNDGLSQENAYLQRVIDSDNVRLQSVQGLEAENSELKALVGRASSTPYLLAAVLKRPPAAAYDELLIDVGDDYNVAEGDVVYASGNVPIGKISAVFGKTSKVSLFSSDGNSYDVLIGPHRTPATAVGRGGGQYEAQLPRDVQVQVGDSVMAPSIETAPFGVVGKVISDPKEPFEQILFAPPVNLYEIKWVLVGDL